ncbi:MAG: hypothetical protein AAF414_19540 [Pseudomonadota bacterium]
MNLPMRYAVAFAVLLTPGLAQAQGDDELPELIGEWLCDQTPLMMRGEPTEARRTITFDAQVGATYSAVMDWEIAREPGVAGDQGGPAFTGTVLMVGVVDWNNRTLHGAAVGDGHLHSAELVDENTMRVIFVESGDNGFAFRSTCTRSG